MCVWYSIICVGRLVNVCEAYRDMVMVTSKRFFSGFFLDFFLVNMTQLPVFRDYYFFYYYSRMRFSYVLFFTNIILSPQFSLGNNLSPKPHPTSYFFYFFFWKLCVQTHRLYLWWLVRPRSGGSTPPPPPFLSFLIGWKRRRLDDVSMTCIRCRWGRRRRRSRSLRAWHSAQSLSLTMMTAREASSYVEEMVELL